MDPNRPTAIYLLLDEDGTPRYAGKSVDPEDRMRGHLRERAWFCCYLILEWTTQSCYKERERYWIKKFRSMGFPLDNGNDGGGGLVFLKEEYKENLRRKNKGKKQSPETSEKHKLNWKRRKEDGFEVSKETREKLSKVNTGKNHSEATIEKIRQNSLDQWERQRAEGYEPSVEQVRHISESVKAKWQDPEYREKTLQGMRRHNETRGQQ